MVAADTIVRMGDWAVSADPGDRLVTIGLGSCIGLVLVDRVRCVAGLAHVMLPSARPGMADELPAEGRGRFGDLAPGAHMFGFGSEQLDVGARNEAAVRDGLAALRLPIRAAATGGDKGRTVRVHVREGRVLVRAAQGADEVIMRGKA